MSEEAKEITVKVKYDPNKDDTIEVKINPNAKVSELEEKVKDALKDSNNVLIGLLKFNLQVLNNKDKTLEELGIKDGSSVENENRVRVKFMTGKMIYITCDENTTVREFLKQLKGKNSGWGYIMLYAGKLLQRSMLDQKLLGCQIDKNSINYGTTLHAILATEESKNSDEVFDLNHLDLDKGKNSNSSPIRIITGIIDLLLLAAAVVTFLLYFLTTLSLSVAVPIVLAALFVTFAVLFLGWNAILPKILPDSCLKTSDLGIDLDEEDKNKIKETENSKKNNPKKEKKDGKEENKDN